MNRHNAPPVVYPLGRSSFLGGLLLSIWLAGLFTVLLWWNAMQQFNWRIALAVLFIALAGLAARSSWNHLPSGQLAWDSEVWRWESPSYQAGSAEQTLWVIADFQHRLLVRLENQAGASLWLWLEKKVLPDRWMDLRRAVYSPHRSLAAPDQHDFLDRQLSTSEPKGLAALGVTLTQVDSQEKS